MDVHYYDYTTAIGNDVMLFHHETGDFGIIYAMVRRFSA